MKKTSRRKFLLKSSKYILMAYGTITFGKYFSLFRKKKLKPLPKGNYKSGNKILIAYETKFGSTAAIAKYIGKSLNSNKEIDIKPINSIQDLNAYDKVIIGSAIQYDHWMSEAKNFVQLNENQLNTKNISYFFVCLTLSKTNKKAIAKADGYATKIANLTPSIKIKNFGQFAGVLDYSKMSSGQRIMAKGIFAVLGIKEGDYRDWDAIKKWSQSIEA